MTTNRVLSILFGWWLTGLLFPACAYSATPSVPAAAAASPVYFLVAEWPGREFQGDSYVLPLTRSADIAHARDLIRLGPQIGSAIVVANIAAGADGVNRDYRAPGMRLWSWHVTDFFGFADFTAEILDGWPRFVESDVAGWIGNTGGRIGFWNYTVVRELTSLAPTITGFWPGAAPAGSFIFVFGQFFVPGQTQVRVNGIDAPLLQVLTNDLLVFMLPVGNTTGALTINTPAGNATGNVLFGTPLSGLKITGIWPAQGRVGNFVFVFGSGYVPATTKVSVGGTPASRVHVMDTNLLLFIVPRSASGGPIMVTTPQGSVTSAAPFIVLP